MLDQIDAGTLTALRVTPGLASVTFFAYRAARVTVVGITTVYVVATMSLSGILRTLLGARAHPDRHGGLASQPWWSRCC